MKSVVLIFWPFKNSNHIHFQNNCAHIQNKILWISFYLTECAQWKNSKIWLEKLTDKDSIKNDCYILFWVPSFSFYLFLGLMRSFFYMFQVIGVTTLHRITWPQMVTIFTLSSFVNCEFLSSIHLNHRHIQTSLTCVSKIWVKTKTI